MKNKKNRKYKGSVLLTVVSVMALLIIFLFGTLVLATSANNRAHVNYSTAQTNVTSRLVAESAINAIDLDADYKKAIGALKSDSSSLKVPVQISSDNTSINTATMGKIDDVEIAYAGQRKFYDTTKNEWINRELIRFTSKVTLGGVTSTTNAYVLKHMAEDDDSSPSGAGYVTTGSSEFTCQTSLYGGAYINIPTPESVKEFKNYEDPTVYKVLPYYAGGPKMDLYNSAGVIEADAVINTNVFVNNWSGFIFPGTGKGVTIWGDMAFSGNSADHLDFTNACKLGTAAYNFNEIPYLYVDGGIFPQSFNGSETTEANAKIAIGNPGVPAGAAGHNTAQSPFNIFAGYIYTRNDNYFGIFGDLYLMDSDKTSVIVGNQAHLYSWTNSVINKTMSASASVYTSAIYSNGSMELGGCQIDGDVRIAKDCIISSDVTINGDLVVGGRLIIKGGAKINGVDKIYCDSVVGSSDVSGNYDKVPTILHPAERKRLDECVSVTNGSRDYYIWKHEEHDNKDINGNEEWNDLYYMYTAEYDGSVDLSADDVDYSKYLQNGKHQWDLPTNPVTNSKDNYLVKTKIDFDSVIKNDEGNYEFDTYLSYEPANTETSYYDLDSGSEIDSDDAYVDIPAYRTKPDWNGDELDPPVKTTKMYVYYTKDDHTEVDEDEVTHGGSGSVSGVTTDTIANFKNSHGNENPYPKYAEKNVILGLELVDNPAVAGEKLRKSETQVVKTMKDVLEQVINPYDNSDIPTALRGDLYTLASSGKVLRNASEIASEMGATVASLTDDSGKVAITTQAGSAGGVYINKSCILDVDITVGSGNPPKLDGKECVVFDPHGEQMLVVIKNFSITDGMKIIVDDTHGGNVFFYLDRGSTFMCNGNNPIVTVSWYNLLKTGTSFQVTSDPMYTMYDEDNPTVAKPLTINQLLLKKAVPNVYIYGAKGSKMTWKNFQFVTANICSPNISLEIDATSASLMSGVEIYYNGNRITGGGGNNYPAIFGCCNSKTATFPNQLNELWVTDGGGKEPPTPPTDDEFWYKVLYYDEY